MSNKEITQSDVLHIAQLVNLTLDENEKAKLSDMLTKTLDFINVLEELNTESVPETYHVTGLTNVFQKKDEKPTTLTQQKALQNAPECVDGYIVTKAVFNR